MVNINSKCVCGIKITNNSTVNKKVSFEISMSIFITVYTHNMTLYEFNLLYWIDTSQNDIV